LFRVTALFCGFSVGTIVTLHFQYVREKELYILRLQRDLASRDKEIARLKRQIDRLQIARFK
jgi:hypothetical protein